jgi:protein AroM
MTGRSVGFSHEQRASSSYRNPKSDRGVMNVQTIVGMATIGQTPRIDVVPAMERILGPAVKTIEAGALDRLTTEEIARLAPSEGEQPIVTRLQDGSSTRLSHREILPRMQDCVDELTGQGAQFVVMLCGADWSEVKSDKLIVNPGKLFPNVITALAAGRRLGIIKPDGGQVEGETRRYASLGIDARVTSASPYLGDARLDAAREAAQHLRDQQVDLVWMTCVGMDERMRETVQEVVQRPVILAQALLARVVAEVVAGVSSRVAVGV